MDGLIKGHELKHRGFDRMMSTRHKIIRQTWHFVRSDFPLLFPPFRSNLFERTRRERIRDSTVTLFSR